MKNNTINIKIFFIFIVAALLATDVKANVIVFQANPGYIYSGETFYLDMDNNGVNDYTITISSASPYTIQVTGINSNNMIETDGNGKAIALNFGAPVGNNSFQNSAIIYEEPGTGFYFQVYSEKYLGLRFQINGNTHFCYFQIRVMNQSVNLYTYGYETTPNQTLSAGALPTSVVNTPDKIVFDVSINSGKLIVSSSTPIEYLELTDINGRLIRISDFIKSSIDITGLTRQVYFLSVYNNRNAKPIAVRKFVLGD